MAARLHDSVSSQLRLPVWLLSAVLATTTGLGSDRTAFGQDAAPSETPGAALQVRVATFNVSMNRGRAGALIEVLRDPSSAQPRQIAEVLQRVRPDIVLLNEFDHDEAGEAARLFETNFLAIGQNGQEPLRYPHRFLAPVNTGEPTGLDLNRDGRADGPNDAFGFGRFPGQYGMLLLSRHPLDAGAARTFRRVLWKSLPEPKLPRDTADGSSWYSPEQLAIFRLSSKSHWDVPARIGNRVVHLLASHPTPPAFDGPEDRHGCRSHDEIRLWADYLTPERAGYLVDDAGQSGGLPESAAFVIVGDLNSDPFDGDGGGEAIGQLLRHPRVQTEPIPSSAGGIAAAQAAGGINLRHRGDPRHDTADFSTPRGPGNLRVDYVLPSRGLNVAGGGVFWPSPEEPGSDLLSASDHRLVWVDLAW